MARRQLLLHLKNCCYRLTSYSHQNTLLDDTLEAVNDVIMAIELFFLYGIRLIEFQGNIPLWFLLESLESSNPPCIPLRNAVGAVASMTTLRSHIGKARGWIRQILNNKGGLDASIQTITSQKIDFIQMFYYPHAIFLQPEDITVLVSHLSPSCCVLSHSLSSIIRSYS